MKSLNNAEQNQVTGSYTDDMMQLLSFMMKTPCITPQATGNTENVRKAAPNPPLAPMHDLTSIVANLQVYNNESSAPKTSFDVVNTFNNCNIVIESSTPTTAQQQQFPVRTAAKPKPIPLLKRDYKSMLLHSLSPNLEGLDFCLSPSLSFLSPRLSPFDGVSICPDKKKVKAALSPLYDSHDLFAVLVDICDGQNDSQDQLYNMGNN